MKNVKIKIEQRLNNKVSVYLIIQRVLP